MVSRLFSFSRCHLYRSLMWLSSTTAHRSSLRPTPTSSRRSTKSSEGVVRNRKCRFRAFVFLFFCCCSLLEKHITSITCPPFIRQYATSDIWRIHSFPFAEEKSRRRRESRRRVVLGLPSVVCEQVLFVTFFASSKNLLLKKIIKKIYFPSSSLYNIKYIRKVLEGWRRRVSFLTISFQLCPA